MTPYNTCLLALFFISFSYAQQSKLDIGVSITPVVTWLRGTDDIDRNFHKRFNVSPGLTLDYNFSDNWFLSSGIAYENKSVIRTTTVTLGDRTFVSENENTQNYEYLNLPLLLGYKTNGRTQFYASAGGFVGILLKQENISIFTTPNSESETVVDNTENTKTTDFGLALATGLKILLTDSLYLDIGARQFLGLTNVSEVELPDNGEIKTNSIGLQVGLKYKI
ncbi:porin family protein [Flagellimonas meishanensis]|uniref:porin family protein n=1 Tax=Flagellimonas meishanensis TaxID=2873264 RepID=UPI001CA67D44|nr:porin family protein [[Muricauda] meishanensis]